MDPVIYRPNAIYHLAARAFAAVLSLVFILLPLMMLINDLKQTGAVMGDSIVVAFLCAGLMVLIVWGGVHDLRTTRLVLSATGLEYYAPGITIKTTWNNVEPIKGGQVAPYLQLYRPAATQVGFQLSYRAYLERRIPLNLFDYSAHSALARDLRRFAPHLFEPSESRSENPSSKEEHDEH